MKKKLTKKELLEKYKGKTPEEILASAINTCHEIMRILEEAEKRYDTEQRIKKEQE